MPNDSACSSFDFAWRRLTAASATFSGTRYLLFGPVRLRIPRVVGTSRGGAEDPAGQTRVRVDVRVILPRLGPLIAYEGIIEVEDTRA